MVERLRADGHEVRYVAELAPGITDDEVLEQANALAAVLVTADKDFGELVYRLAKVSPGVLLIRLHGWTPAERADAVSIAVGQHASELAGAVAVLSPSRLRIRRPERPDE